MPIEQRLTIRDFAKAVATLPNAKRTIAARYVKQLLDDINAEYDTGEPPGDDDGEDAKWDGSDKSFDEFMEGPEL